VLQGLPVEMTQQSEAQLRPSRSMDSAVLCCGVPLLFESSHGPLVHRPTAGIVPGMLLLLMLPQHPEPYVACSMLQMHTSGITPLR